MSLFQQSNMICIGNKINKNHTFLDSITDKDDYTTTQYDSFWT